MARRLTSGSPEPLGVAPDAKGVNVAVFSAHATAIELCLFDAAGARELERIRLPERTGDVFHGHIQGVAQGERYGLRAHGPFAPAEGHRFNPAKLLLDPYAISIDRAFVLHPSMFAERASGAGPELLLNTDDSGPFMPKAVVAGETPTPAARAPLTAWPDTVIYELHVRGFSKLHPDIPAPLRGTFAALGHPAAIEHLVKLGITTVEVMPPAAWIDERHLADQGLSNHWGYNPVAWMAPDPRLAPGGWQEIAAATAALAEAGVETILDVVLNHTGEGDALGPTLSLRGLDNASYYRLHPEDQARYIDDTGTGNTLALDRPPAVRLAMDALRTWARRGGLAGFRFDLAPIMGRRAGGFDPDAPLLTAIRQDPELRGLKLIAEPWDVGPGGYQIGRFPADWGEWNDRFRDTARRFWRGDDGQMGEFATRLAGSSDLFAAKSRPGRGVNFVAAHDGFTTADLVAFQAKHNLANGEGNRDGTDSNWSWNNGVEGPSDDPAVAAVRLNDQRALLASLLLARGTPMLAMGAELGHSQGGNNNAYAQDNETAWIDWEAADAGLLDFTAALTRLRRKHPALRVDRFLTGEPFDESLLPDVEWRTPDGRAMGAADWGGGVLVATLNEPLDRVTLVFNRDRAATSVILPAPRDGFGWRVEIDTAKPAEAATLVDGDGIDVAARSVVLLAEAPAPGRRSVAASPESLERLAHAAGVGGEWYDIEGRRHVVGDDAKRAFLAAMNLSAATADQARGSLALLAEEFDGRALPWSAAVREGEPGEIRLTLAPGISPAGIRLAIEGEDGSIGQISAAGLTLGQVFGPDGRVRQVVTLPLPPLKMGRYILRRDDEPEAVCRLTVAPAQCWLPAELQGAGRRFGLAAHLYALQCKGDQGIGDFTTLGAFAEAAARQGAAVIGINPLHALFGAERGRASPYQPSDRRFIDPIYIDVSSLGGPAAASPNPSSVDYAGVWAAKAAVLERSFTASANHPELVAFAAAGGMALQRFAVFEALSEANPGPWTQWPADLRDPDNAAVAAFAEAHADRVRFHIYLQWLADSQLAEAAARGRQAGLSLGLYRDLAIGAAPDGAEAWCSAGLLAPEVSIGAPPDPLGPEGQVWALPPPDPWAMRRTGGAAFAALLAANMRHAGALRIDHVMGLRRLFWVPDGASAADGAYVDYPFEQLLAELSLESARARCLVVGEDLGTIPPDLRQRLTEAQVLSYRVLYFERDGEAFLPPQAYPANAAACVSTHDLPTLRGWWRGADIDERLALALFTADEASAARAERERDKQALIRALVSQRLLQSEFVPHEPPAGPIHAYLAASPARLVLAQVDDLAGELTGVNLPGTDRQRPNWRRKVSLPVETLADWPLTAEILGALRAVRGG